jgi:ubiquinol-cytochrome c reductase cytochrome b subunit
LSQFNIYNYIAFFFIFTNFILLWLGMQPVEAPFIVIGQIATVLYFRYLLIALLMDYCLSSLL